MALLSLYRLDSSYSVPGQHVSWCSSPPAGTTFEQNSKPTYSTDMPPCKKPILENISYCWVLSFWCTFFTSWRSLLFALVVTMGSGPLWVGCWDITGEVHSTERLERVEDTFGSTKFYVHYGLWGLLQLSTSEEEEEVGNWKRVTDFLVWGIVTIGCSGLMAGKACLWLSRDQLTFFWLGGSFKLKRLQQRWLKQLIRISVRAKQLL